MWLSGLSVNVGESQITQSLKVRDLGVTFDQFLNFDDHITAICRSTYFHIRNIGKNWNLLSYNACSTIIHALISCRLDYCNSLLYNVPTHKTDRLQRLQNQCTRILTKSPRREHITLVLKSLHWLKIQDRITYKILMLTLIFCQIYIINKIYHICRSICNNYTTLWRLREIMELSIADRSSCTQPWNIIWKISWCNDLVTILIHSGSRLL